MCPFSRQGTTSSTLKLPQERLPEAGVTCLYGHLDRPSSSFSLEKRLASLRRRGRMEIHVIKYRIKGLRTTETFFKEQQRQKAKSNVKK